VIYGVPQAQKDKLTGRAKRIHLVAEDAPDELFITALHKAFENETLMEITIRTENGGELTLVFDHIE